MGNIEAGYSLGLIVHGNDYYSSLVKALKNS